ncbi:MAG: hypothetical protein Greene071436_320, partial [Parcubacteria group bacterium Greene0714_36]
LIRHGFDVTVLDTGFFKDGILFPPSMVRTVFKDARDVQGGDLKGVDAVVHLAGISNDPFGNLSVEKIYDPTRRYARDIAMLCKKKGIRFIFASSCSVYGKGSDAVLDEDSSVTPQTPYSINKLQIEGDLRMLADKTFSPIALRFATAFGVSPRMRFDIVINMLVGMAVAEKKIVLNSDGQAWRPHVHINDIAESLLCALRFPYTDGGLLILNVGREDNNMKIIDTAKIVGEECGNIPISFMTGASGENDLIKSTRIGMSGEDTRTYRVSFKKIKEYFPEFECPYSIRAGVREMIEKFIRIKLDRATLNDPKFYRLQALEKLFQGGKINDDLRGVTQ